MPLKRVLLLAGIGASLLTTSCADRSAPPPRTFPMGEKVQVGKLIYTVFETSWLTQAGDPPNVRVPQNRFLLLRVSITNAGASEVIVPSISLVDDSGETIPEVTNGEGIPQWIGLLRQVKPAESAQGNLVFDVTPKHYKLRVTDETEQLAGLVDIPLSFGAETPELPAAQAPVAPQLSSPGGSRK